MQFQKSTFPITISILFNIEEKWPFSIHILKNTYIKFLDFNKFFNPVPKPSHPGNINLHMAQENTHGIARKLSIAKSFPLDDGLLKHLDSQFLLLCDIGKKIFKVFIIKN